MNRRVQKCAVRKLSKNEKNKFLSDKKKIEESKIFIMNKVEILKNELSATDYMIIKHLDGRLSDEEYLDIKNKREAIIDEIHVLEAKIGNVV